VNAIIQRTFQQQAPDLEVHLIPNCVPIGKGNQKFHTTAVELQVDRKNLLRTRELLIELFDTQKDSLPRDIYFVPTPTNGTLDYDTYYQHLGLHHAHVTNLRSFAITNICDIKTEITIYGPHGTSNPRTMTFEQALLSKTKKGTIQTLFYSIEPTAPDKHH
jgi:hypothetical protein